jgi:hypothetical protein
MATGAARSHVDHRDERATVGVSRQRIDGGCGIGRKNIVGRGHAARPQAGRLQAGKAPAALQGPDGMPGRP